jgi:CMP-N,N'-diacetyllegionaminic acid synthase
MEVLALVTARGGSKGIPRKNLIPFLGRPLIEWTIRSALDALSVSRVIVTTDDKEIAAEGLRCGAEVPFIRPAELATDSALDLPVFLHAVKWLDAHEGYRPDLIVHLRPTTPLRPPGLIDRGVALLAADLQADSLRSVCVPQNNPFKMWVLQDRYMQPLFESGIAEQYNQPRQKLPAAYWQTGTIDITRTETVLEKNSMTGCRILPLVVDSRIAVDIDDEPSHLFAEAVCRRFGMSEIGGSK